MNFGGKSEREVTKVSSINKIKEIDWKGIMSDNNFFSKDDTKTEKMHSSHTTKYILLFGQKCIH